MMNIPKKYSGYLVACFLLVGACCPNPLYAQGSKAINSNNAISISLIPEIGFNYSYYHLTSKAYRRNFRITTLGDMRNFYWSLGLQFELWNEWRATLTLGQTDNGGDRVSHFSRFSNLPENAHFPQGDHLQDGFPAALFTLNFSKTLWRFKMGAIKGVALGSELDVLFGAGVLWINGRVYKDGGTLSRSRPNSMAWESTAFSKYVANPEHLSVGIVNIGLSYRLYINNKTRFIFKALYSYGLQGTYLMDYTSRYSFENFINNTKESSVEDFQAETGRHQFTLSIAYPIALYRNKAKKKYLKKEATP